MDSSEKDEFLSKLNELKKEYADTLPEKLKSLEQLAASLGSISVKSDVFLQLIRAVHNLLGSGGSFGFPELSERAFKLEKVLRDWQESDVPLGELEQKTIHKHLESMHKAAFPTKDKL